MTTEDGQVSLIEERVPQLEQEGSYSRGGPMSGTLFHCFILLRIMTIPLTKLNKIDTKSEDMLQVTSGQRCHRLIESPTMCHYCLASPYHIAVNFIFHHIHAANQYLSTFLPMLVYIPLF